MIEYVSGCVGGVAGVIVGQPLDTIKVRLQTQTGMYRGITHCFRNIIGKEGMHGLFKGMSSPLVGLSFINAIVFGVEAQSRKCFGEQGLMSHFLSGATAGGVQTIICCPMELAKTQMQIQGIGSNRTMKYKTSLDALKHIYEFEGARGFYRGMTSTILRDAPAFGGYFMTYHFLTTSVFHVSIEGDYQKSDIAKMLLSGGISGVVSWIVTYPVDVVKSRIQADGSPGKGYQYRGFIDCVTKLYRTEGSSVFFVGMNSSLLRAFPVNAATFAVVHVVARNLSSISDDT